MAFIASAQQPSLLLSQRASDDSDPSADPDSGFWKTIKGVSIESSILGQNVTNLHAEIRSRWTANNLYSLFIGHYDVLNLKTNPDTTTETYRLWENDCFEAYAGADFEHVNLYKEFQMSPQGEFLDLDIDASKPRPGYNGEQLWNSGMKVRARIDEARKIWCGEMRIPISAIDKRPAQVGNELRVNFCRQDGRGWDRTFLAWQPTGAWNPHRPAKFGTLKLIGND